MVFTCDHCPNAQMYEGRVTQLYNDYKDKGVAVVAISPNDPKAIRIDELDSSDVSDTLEEMKIRVAYKHLPYPYLYDGETESVSQAYGPQASPHIFIFDQQRKLRYEGAIDDSYRIEFVKRHYALDAIDALLADKEVAVKHTGAFGCSTKWSDKEAANVALHGEAECATYFAGDGLSGCAEVSAYECGWQCQAHSVLVDKMQCLPGGVRRYPGHLPDVQRSQL